MTPLLFVYIIFSVSAVFVPYKSNNISTVGKKEDTKKTNKYADSSINKNVLYGSSNMPQHTVSYQSAVSNTQKNSLINDINAQRDFEEVLRKMAIRMSNIAANSSINTEDLLNRTLGEMNVNLNKIGDLTQNIPVVSTQENTNTNNLNASKSLDQNQSIIQSNQNLDIKELIDNLVKDIAATVDLQKNSNNLNENNDNNSSNFLSDKFFDIKKADNLRSNTAEDVRILNQNITQYINGELVSNNPNAEEEGLCVYSFEDYTPNGRVAVKLCTKGGSKEDAEKAMAAFETNLNGLLQNPLIGAFLPSFLNSPGYF